MKNVLEKENTSLIDPDSEKTQSFEDIDLSVFINSADIKDVIPKKEIKVELKEHGKKDFQKKVESYYIHQQLADALLIKGEIPINPVESTVGIAFLDIANYSYLSKWLSPKENQILLNGLYSAFTYVIKKNGGFLNKIEGDSLMFHFGGIIDPEIQNMSQHETNNYITRSLFYTCVEVQRTCQLFNNASKLFLDENTSAETKESIEQAFNIISTLRMNLSLASGVDAKFQIKIRIGASIGEVSIGNFGPKGKKQWDIIGEPVIEAKRMETTAPIDGLRISEKMYNFLDKENITHNYYDDFKNKAIEKNGLYKNIKINELFSFKEVIIERKHNVHFNTYSVLVNNDLPEQISKMVISFLELREDGAEEIIQLIQYYRNNRLVITGIETALKKHQIYINKIELLNIMSPKKVEKLKTEYVSNFNNTINNSFSLYRILTLLGSYQDRINTHLKPSPSKLILDVKDGSYLEIKKSELMNDFKIYEKKLKYKVYFDQVIYPLIFDSIKSDIFQSQNKL